MGENSVFFIFTIQKKRIKSLVNYGATIMSIDLPESYELLQLQYSRLTVGVIW